MKSFTNQIHLFNSHQKSTLLSISSKLPQWIQKKGQRRNWPSETQEAKRWILEQFEPHPGNAKRITRGKWVRYDKRLYKMFYVELLDFGLMAVAQTCYPSGMMSMGLQYYPEFPEKLKPYTCSGALRVNGDIGDSALGGIAKLEDIYLKRSEAKYEGHIVHSILYRGPRNRTTELRFSINRLPRKPYSLAFSIERVTLEANVWKRGVAPIRATRDQFQDLILNYRDTIEDAMELEKHKKADEAMDIRNEYYELIKV